MTIDESIKAWLASERRNSSLIRTWDLTGGLSSGMVAFEVQDAIDQKESFIVRQPSDWTLSQIPQAAKEEFALLKFLQKEGIPAPVPVFLDTTGSHFARQSVILKYIEANTQLSPENPDRYLEAYAKQLAEIHKTNTAKSALPYLKAYDASLSDRSKEETAELDADFAYSDCKNVLKGIWPVPRINELTLLHGDYWPGNSLWRDERISAVIDWEESCLDDPLIDLAISRLDTRWVFGRAGMEAFTEYYLQANPIKTDTLAYWDLYAAIRPGNRLEEWASSYPIFGRTDVTYQSMTNERRAFAREALNSLK